MCDPTYNRLTPPNLLTRLARPQGPQEAGGQLGDQPQPSLRCSLSHMCGQHVEELIRFGFSRNYIKASLS